MAVRMSARDFALVPVEPVPTQTALPLTPPVPPCTPIDAPLTEVHLDPEQVEEWRRQFTGRELSLPL